MSKVPLWAKHVMPPRVRKQKISPMHALLRVLPGNIDLHQHFAMHPAAKSRNQLEI
jgi:hypothetical protein